MGQKTLIGRIIFFNARACVRAFGHVAICLVISTNPAITFAAEKKSAAEAQALAQLKSLDKAKRFQALGILKKSKSRSSSLALVQQVGIESDVHVKLAIMDTLAERGEFSTVSALESLLQDPHPAVRQRAALSIAASAGPSSVSALQKQFAQENNSAVRLTLQRCLMVLQSDRKAAK